LRELNETIDVTVAAVIEENQRFLLVEERVAGEIVLNQPAGHVEPAEAVLDAVVRETLEETGYRFQPEALIGIYTWRSEVDDRSFLRLCFSGPAQAPEGPVELDEGIIAARWLSLGELTQRAADLRSPLVIRAIEDYRSGNRFPIDCFRHVGAEQSAARRAFA
jgi:8-oxo-dGTP pyrophosphatase MutT (NUDIX family)